jgi:hypothetical protein
VPVVAGQAARPGVQGDQVDGGGPGVGERIGAGPHRRVGEDAEQPLAGG